jgi:hypothetical protein
MVQLTLQQRVFVVENFFTTKSYVEVQRLFQIEFPNRLPPTTMTIHRNVIKYRQHATSQNRNSKNSGRRRTGRSNENIDRVQEALEENPRGIVCRRNGLGLTRATFNRIVSLDLKWHPYKIRVRHELKPTDPDRRIRFCRWFLEKCRDRRFLQNFIIGDEAGFAMNGSVNTQNVREYAPKGQPPDFFYQRNECRTRITVWVGLCGNGKLIGPFFFEGSVNGLRYLEMLNEKVFPKLVQLFGDQFDGDHFSRLWWAQDGAPAHGALDIRAWLAEFFPNHTIALHHNHEWPPRSPDLTPCDFFLWGYVKSRVYVSPPASVDDLRQRIIREIAHVKRDEMMIKRAVRDMVRRSRTCIQEGGKHIEHLL